MSPSAVPIERRTGGRLQAIHPGQAGIGELIARGLPAVATALGRPSRRRVVGMGLEWDDSNLHPLVQRQRAEQTVELGSAVGSVQPEDLRLAGDGPLPHPDEMSLRDQLGGAGCLGGFACRDLGFRGTARNDDLELDEEFHHVLLVPRPEQTRQRASVSSLARTRSNPLLRATRARPDAESRRGSHRPA